jgi:hypothetical protein
MKIHYKKKRLKHAIIFGGLWLILGTLAIIFNPDNIFSYGYIFMGFLYFGTYIFENKKQYLTIENGTISRNGLITKKINLTDIIIIKKFAGDYILKTDKTDFKINTQIIEKESLIDLNNELEKLNLELN